MVMVTVKHSHSHGHSHSNSYSNSHSQQQLQLQGIAVIIIVTVTATATVSQSQLQSQSPTPSQPSRGSQLYFSCSRGYSRSSTLQVAKKAQQPPSNLPLDYSTLLLQHSFMLRLISHVRGCYGSRHRGRRWSHRCWMVLHVLKGVHHGSSTLVGQLLTPLPPICIPLRKST